MKKKIFSKPQRRQVIGGKRRVRRGEAYDKKAQKFLCHL